MDSLYGMELIMLNKKGKDAKWPLHQSFIPERYPANKIYIEILAQKVIAGGTGSWGSPVMDPHPKLSLEDAKTMVSYILSMKE